MHMIDTILKNERGGSSFFNVALIELLGGISGDPYNSKGWDCFLTNLLRGKIRPDSREVRRFFPFLSVNVTPIHGDVSDSHEIDSYAYLYERESLFLKKLEGFLIGNKSEIKEYSKSLGSIFILRDEIRGILSRIIDNDKLSVFFRDKGAIKGKKQITFVPTFRCPMKCSYCVNKDITFKDMSYRHFTSALRWLDNNGCDIVSFSGGEPTSHERFSEMILSLSEKYEIHFATNLMFGPGVRNVLYNESVTSLTVHMPGPGEQSREQRELFIDNLRAFKLQKKKMRFRYNISRFEDEKTWEPLLTFVKSMGHNIINFALTVPGRSRTNEFVNTGELNKMGGVAKNFIEYSGIRNVKVNISKPIPPCCISDEKDPIDIYPTICNIYKEDYTINTTILPDLSVSPCFAVMKKFKMLTDYKDWDGIRKDVKPYVTSLIQKPLLDKCGKCYLFMRGICMGGCLGYKTDGGYDA